MDDSVDANTEADDSKSNVDVVKSVSAGGEGDDSNLENEAEAAEREASILSQIAFLESLPEESVIPYLQAQLEPFTFPKECSVTMRRLTKKNLKLFYRFLKVDSVTLSSNKISEVHYTVKESRFESEFFEKKFETLRQERERVRAVLENRRQWFEMYPKVIELIEERAQVHDEIDELDKIIDANTSGQDDRNVVANLGAEKKLEELMSKKELMYQMACDLRKKENEMQNAMKALDSERLLLLAPGVLFDEDESWMDDEARESLESLMAKMAADKELLKKDGDESDTDEDSTLAETMKSFGVEEEVPEDLGIFGSNTDIKEPEEDVGEKGNMEDADLA